MNTGSDNSSLRSEKSTKILLDPLIFTNIKNRFIDQLLSKMQIEFEINKDHYLINGSKLIYKENRARRKDL